MDTQSLNIPEPKIDGPWRVDSYGAKLVPARNGSGYEELKLIDHSALAIYGDLEDSDLKEILRHSLSWAQRQPDSIIFLPLDRSGAISEALAALGKPTPIATALDLDELRSFLRSLLDYSLSYSDLLKASGLTWSSNGKYLLPVIPLNPESASDPRVESLLKDLLTVAQSTPIRPFLIADRPQLISPEVQALLSWQAFIGSDAMGYRRDRYPMDIVPGMASRVAVGVAVDRTSGSARVLNGLNYEPTAAALERKRAVADDAAGYEIFLEGLTDGR